MTTAQTYQATIRHHSIASARTITVTGNLTQAKRAATAEFGDGYNDHKIVIANDRGDIVASRTIADKSWTNAA